MGTGGIPDKEGTEVTITSTEVTITSRCWKLVALRVAVGTIFLYAGATKIVDPEHFAGSVAAYRILPHLGNYLVASTLPWLEAMCGIMLVVGIGVRTASFVLLLLMSLFIVLLTIAIGRGLDIDCGCFRAGGSKTTPFAALMRDVVLFAVIFVEYRLSVEPD